MSMTALDTFTRATAAVSAVTGTALGGVGVLAYVQARLATGKPHERELDHAVDGAVGDGPSLRRVVWIGDSLAAGMGAVSADVTLPRFVAANRAEPTRIHSFAVPGATAADVVDNQLGALQLLRRGLAEVGERIDAIGVSVGANDIGAFTPRRRFRSLLRDIVDAADGTPIVFVSIPELADAIRLPHPLRDVAAIRASWLNATIREVAGESGNQYACVRRRPAWISRRDRATFLSADRFHPSGAGYAVWSSRVADAFDLALAPTPSAG